MSYWAFWKSFFCMSFCRLYISNDSTSKTKTTTSTSTENQTSSQVVDGGTAVNLSRSKTGAITINNTQTDHGSIDSAFKFATTISQGTLNAQTQALSEVADATKSAIASVDAAHTGVDQKLANAYTEAKAGEQKMFGVAMMAVVAVVVAKVFGKK